MKGRINEGRGRSPGLRACDQGSVTVEAAGALMALTLFFSILASSLSIFGAEFALSSLARDGARAASLQSDRAGADQAVRRVLRNASGVRYELREDNGFLVVTLHKAVRVLRIEGAIDLLATASALQESPW